MLNNILTENEQTNKKGNIEEEFFIASKNNAN